MNLTGKTIDLSKILQISYAPAAPTDIINNGHQIQTQFYVDQPVIKFGNSFGVAGVSPKLHINMSFYQPTYWDMWLTD